MRILNARLTSSPLPSSIVPKSAQICNHSRYKLQCGISLQRRILLTAVTAASSKRRSTSSTSPPPPPPPPPRSPHQWSHIVHSIRNPAYRPDAAIMGKELHLNGSQTRTHMGHSHGHHHHDNTYLTSSNKSDAGVRITRIGLYVNLGMAIAKGTGGIVFNSQALTADALHALTDLVSDMMTLATISYSLRPPTSRFPLGYGKVESLGALAVSGLLLSGGVMIGLQAVMALCQQFFPELASILSHLAIFGHGHSHHHGAEDFGPNINAAWLAGGSIIIKEWLYRATMKVARQKRSNVLQSNAYHHRVDSLTAFVALVTILASRVLSNAHWLDPVGGLLISGMIVQAGWGNTKASLFELADVAVDGEIKDSVEKAARKAIEGRTSEVQIRGVQGVKSGQNFLVDLEVGVPSNWTLAEQQDVESLLRQSVVDEVRGVHRVAITFTTNGDEKAPFADQYVNGRGVHDHDHNHGHESECASHDHSDTVTNGHTAKTTSRQTDETTHKRT